ncbi:MAG: PadR family transcriptional regulator [Microbacteriaceae bacterium]
MSYELMPLAVAALALLAERPMHPYEMYQTMVMRKEDRIVKCRPGSLYHAINKLEEAELIRAVGTDRDGNRPERTTYEITDEGHERFASRIADLIVEPVNEYPRFPLAIGEAHNLPLTEVITLLRIRLAALATDREHIVRDINSVTDRGVPAAFWLDLPYLLVMHDAEVTWIDNLITELETGAVEWGVDLSPIQKDLS